MNGLIQQIDAGEIPLALSAQVRRAVEEQAETPRPRGLLPDFSAWFGRKRAAPPETDWQIWELKRFEDGGFFRTQRIVWVSIRGRELEGRWLPHGGSFGLVSVGPERVLYLNRRQANVEAALRAEGRPLDEAAPVPLAKFFAETLGREVNSAHDVIESPEHIAHYQGNGAVSGDGYELDCDEFTRIKARIPKPAISRNGDAWLITFCSVFGWMHDKKTLVLHRYRVQFEHCAIAVRTEVLSKRIFRVTPRLRY